MNTQDKVKDLEHHVEDLKNHVTESVDKAVEKLASVGTQADTAVDTAAKKAVESRWTPLYVLGLVAIGMVAGWILNSAI